MKKYFLAILLILVSSLHIQAEDYNFHYGYGWTSNKNYAYITIDGVLYLAPFASGNYSVGESEILVRYPSGKTDTEFEIPSSIRYIADNAFKVKKTQKTDFSKKSSKH